MRTTSLLTAAAVTFLVSHAAQAQTGDHPPPAAGQKSEERMPPPEDAGTASDETDRPDAARRGERAAAQRDARQDRIGDRRGPRRDRDRMMPPPPSRAAEFRIENGPLKLDVKCAEDEPMQACADIASRLLGQAMGTAPR